MSAKPHLKPPPLAGEVARRQSGVTEGADVVNNTNLSFAAVGACIARPLIGNVFFLSKIDVIGTLGICGRPM